MLVGGVHQHRVRRLLAVVGERGPVGAGAAFGPPGAEGGALRDLRRVDRRSFDGDAIDRWLFSGNRNLVRETWVGGRRVVANGRHVQRDAIEARYRATMAELLAD